MDVKVNRITFPSSEQWWEYKVITNYEAQVENITLKDFSLGNFKYPSGREVKDIRIEVTSDGHVYDNVLAFPKETELVKPKCIYVINKLNGVWKLLGTPASQDYITRSVRFTVQLKFANEYAGIGDVAYSIPQKYSEAPWSLILHLR